MQFRKKRTQTHHSQRFVGHSHYTLKLDLIRTQKQSIDLYIYIYIYVVSYAKIELESQQLSAHDDPLYILLLVLTCTVQLNVSYSIHICVRVPMKTSVWGECIYQANTLYMSLPGSAHIYGRINENLSFGTLYIYIYIYIRLILSIYPLGKQESGYREYQTDIYSVPKPRFSLTSVHIYKMSLKK